MRSENMNESDSCLGVIGLSLSATLIAIIQLIYSAMGLILIGTTIEHIPRTDIHSLTPMEVFNYYQQIFIYATGFIASCILGIGSFM